MIISLHIPKCGGTSFRELLRDHFRLRFKKDYDFPIHTPVHQRTREAGEARKWIRRAHKYLLQYRFTQCIHGHFLPYKYGYFYGMNNCIFATWLRDPIERLVSHYYFWQRSYEETRHPMYLQKKVIEEGWTLQEFAFSDEMRNLYSQFLWKFPVEQFHFIGITEYYEEDLKYFAQKYLGIDDAPVPLKNVNPQSTKPSFEDKGLINDLRSFHARDYEIYEYALNLRKRRKM